MDDRGRKCSLERIRQSRPERVFGNVMRGWKTEQMGL